MTDKIMDFFKSVVANLAAIFRHIVPGCVALAFAWLSHPSWFTSVRLDNSTHLWLIGSAALLIGNVVYVLHRTIIHQMIDLLVSKHFRKPSTYVRVVVRMIRKHFSVKDEIRDLMHLKNSQIILTAIFGEFCIWVSIWKEPNTLAEAHAVLFFVLGILAFAGAVVAHAISHHVGKILPEEAPKATPANRRSAT